MHDNFRHHSDDWSRVPRSEAPGCQGYGADSDTILAFPSGRYGQQVIVRDPTPYVVTTRAQLSVGMAYVLWLLFGLLGAHYYYIGRIGLGVLWMLTGGLFGIGWICDLFTLKGQVERINRR